MKTVLSSSLLYLCFLVANALPQSPGTGSPLISPGETVKPRTPQEIEALRKLDRAQQEQVRRLDNFRKGNSPSGMADASYTKKNKEFAYNLLIPGEQENKTYKEFFNQPKTGFITLLTEKNCSQFSEDSFENCGNPYMPGDGYFFSFRKRNYNSKGLADLGFMQGWFMNYGYITQSLFCELGDVPIESVNLQSDGVKFLTEFVPADNLNDANKQRIELEKGIVKGSFIYFNAVKAAVNQTYVLRSIAYNGKLVKIFKIGDKKISVDYLKDDNRKDITVVFRVTGKNEKGDLKIVWKELQSKTSPKFDMPEQEINQPVQKK